MLGKISSNSSRLTILTDFSILEKSIKVVSLTELLNIFPSVLEGKLSNKILVDVNK